MEAGPYGNKKIEYEMKKNIAIIPARGGSKRIPKKNIVDFNGKPMIAWTIKAALESGIFSKVLVSTDSEEIASHSRDFGAEVPFLRDEFYDDITPVSTATCDALIKAQEYWGIEFNTVTQLMANCPLRNAKHISSFYKKFEDYEVDFLLSCFKFGWMNPWWAFRKNENNGHSFLFAEAIKERSQDLDDLFCPTGSIWMAKAQAIMKSKSFYGPGQIFEEIDWIAAVDIDDYNDLNMAKSLFQTSYY